MRALEARRRREGGPQLEYLHMPRLRKNSRLEAPPHYMDYKQEFHRLERAQEEPVEEEPVEVQQDQEQEAQESRLLERQAVGQLQVEQPVELEPEPTQSLVLLFLQPQKRAQRI